MSGHYRIRGYDSLELIFEKEVPGNFSQKEICEILLRLTCTTLSLDEIVDSSRRRNDSLRKLFLDRIGRSLPIQYGHNPYFEATYIKSK